MLINSLTITLKVIEDGEEGHPSMPGIYIHAQHVVRGKSRLLLWLVSI